MRHAISRRVKPLYSLGCGDTLRMARPDVNNFRFVVQKRGYGGLKAKKRLEVASTSSRSVKT
jgi:hypothetical protein